MFFEFLKILCITKDFCSIIEKYSLSKDVNFNMYEFLESRRNFMMVEQVMCKPFFIMLYLS